ncbi:MAG: VWA domain-containing protein [Saprospiraceae bacterium]|nr:VWA domain-containing protein [Saprospiraceae bacterium]
MSKDLIKRHTSLTANIVAFCRYLRTEGFVIAAPEEADALKTIEILQPYNTPETMRLALKICLTRHIGQAERFDELYDYYWKQVQKATDSKIADQKKEKQEQKPKPKGQDAQFQSLKSWLLGEKSDEELELHTFSATETLSKKDFSTLSEEELRDMFELIQMIARRLARQQNRRFSKHKNGQLDLRRTLRQNLRRGGEIVDLMHKKQQKRRLELVLICDVSKSMELYSRFLIQFAYAFQQVFRRIETFVFSTQLTPITDILRGSDFVKSLENLSERVPHWSGGTRIGESLAHFTQEFGQKHLSSRTVVIIISDGWDTGDATHLTEAMSEIHRKAHRVIWLNPLAGNPNFEPSTAAMQAALPFVDVFAAAHNAESLRQLYRYL